MSEAERLNRGCDIDDEPAESVAGAGDETTASAPVPSASDRDDSWQTVNFPGAIELDTLPIEAISVQPATPTADLEVTSALASLNQLPIADGEQPCPSLPASSTEVVPSWQQENRALHDRIVELETDLAQQQVELQLERARSLHSQPQPIVHPTDGTQSNADLLAELNLSQEHMTQLFKELELSQQATQRQQILVETLSAQLDSSQERIAQLERDCALAQQRYNEQVQKLMQAENAGRDLRMRLHRQQRQTLQFKAALEKCLEMPPSQAQPHLLNPEVGLSVPAVVVPPIAAAQVTTPKNQPVKPWSAASEFPADNGFGTGFSKPLAKIVSLHSADPTEAIVPSSDPLPQDAAEQTGDWADQLFAQSSDNPFYAGMSTEQGNGIFDPALLMATEADTIIPSEPATIDPEMSADPSRQDTLGDDGLLKMLASVPLDSDDLGTTIGSFWGQPTQDDPLWDDLEKLIERPTSPPVTQAEAMESPNTEPETEQHQDVVPIVAGEPAVIAPAPKKPLELVSWGTRSGAEAKPEPLPAEEQATIAPLPVAAAPVRSFAVTPVAKPMVTTEAPTLNVEMLTSGAPSPVIYPLRSSKKLKSLAAVELPTFPRAR
jgi:hypothetical protein